MGALLLKVAAGAGLGWLLMHGVDQRVRAEALAAAHTYFGQNGTFTAAVRSQGLFGNLSGRIGEIDIRIADAHVTSLRFDLERPRGPSGRIGVLTVQSTNLVLARIRLQQFSAKLRDIRYRLNDAIWNNRLVLVGAGPGTAQARISPAALQLMLAGRHGGVLSGVHVGLSFDAITLTGELSLLGARLPFAAAGRLCADEQGRLDFVPDWVRWAGHELASAQLQLLTRMINPAFDPSIDLGTGTLLRMTGARVANGCVVLDADLTLPDASPALKIRSRRRE
ncbi:MAG: hypothetical protein KGJ62_05095 [Armatimonadetes bacterium]|nr:hypothetical protein [Armatimonadota bacterium]MDE2205438.1 hypothetical protein [Armatimonadota bacterium]